ncbi:MAG: hypothetical protein ACOY3Y_17150 [Acidobacteriota bacterium]
MTLERACSRISALLTCGAVCLVFGSLRFARSVLAKMLDGSELEHTEVSRLTTVALSLTRSEVLAGVLLAGVVAVAASEVVVRDREARLLVQVGVLLLLALLASTAMVGLFLPFHVPAPRIP